MLGLTWGSGNKLWTHWLVDSEVNLANLLADGFLFAHLADEELNQQTQPDEC